MVALVSRRRYKQIQRFNRIQQECFILGGKVLFRENVEREWTMDDSFIGVAIFVYCY